MSYQLSISEAEGSKGVTFMEEWKSVDFWCLTAEKSGNFGRDLVMRLKSYALFGNFNPFDLGLLASSFSLSTFFL